MKKTITAIATPVGEGGVGIIRVSGSDALSISQKLLNVKLDKPRYFYRTTLQTANIKDDVMAVYFKAPNSFTGEDVVELHCHGNYLILNNVVAALIQKGCTIAEPGEFTRRAFLNGKLDLSCAEGLIDLIRAKSISSINSAYNQLKGGLFIEVESIIKNITALLAQASSSIDYPEEDLEESTVIDIKKTAQLIVEKLTKLKNSYNDGRLLRDGVRVAIIGEPNVGKSLLLNRLLGEERAIVTSEAGTTRDTIEESFNYKGALFTVIDTAGIREGKSEAERLGIQKSKAALNSADIVLCIYTVEKDFNLDVPKDKPCIFICNKIDLYKDKNIKSISNHISISALQNKGIDKIKEELYNLSIGKISTVGASINNLRHLNAVTNSISHLERIKSANSTTPIDCVLSDLSLALSDLSAITGKFATDEVVNEIFNSFCVGK